MLYADDIDFTDDDGVSGQYIPAYSVDEYIEEFSSNINATQTENSTASAFYGMAIWGDYGVGTITQSSTITVNSVNAETYGIDVDGANLDYMNGTVKVNVSGTGVAVGIGNWGYEIQSIAGKVEVTTVSGLAYGLYNYMDSNVVSISGSIDVKTDSGTAYGIFNNIGSSIENVTGNIDVSTGSGTAYGIYAGNPWYFTSDETTSIGEVSGDITVTTESASTAVGLMVASSSTAGNVTGDITVSAGTSTTIAGIQVNQGSSIGVIDSQITVTAKDDADSSSIAYGVKMASVVDAETGVAADVELTLGEGTSITVTGAESNYALHNETGGITLSTTESVNDSSTKTITLTGDIYVSVGNTVTFTDGDYTLVDCDMSEGTGITIVSGASVTVDGDFDLNFSSINFVITEDYDGSALLTIAEGANLTDEMLQSTIYVYLDDFMTAQYEADPSSISLNLLYFEDPSDSSYFVNDDSAVEEISSSVVLMVSDGSGGYVNVGTTTLDPDGDLTVVPEPATATLSFVALLGLCARRRRALAA